MNEVLKVGRIYSKEDNHNLYKILSFNESEVEYEFINKYYNIKIINCTVDDFFELISDCIFIPDGLQLYELEALRLGHYIEIESSPAKELPKGSSLTLYYNKGDEELSVDAVYMNSDLDHELKLEINGLVCRVDVDSFTRVSKVNTSEEAIPKEATYVIKNNMIVSKSGKEYYTPRKFKYVTWDLPDGNSIIITGFTNFMLSYDMRDGSGCTIKRGKYTSIEGFCEKFDGAYTTRNLEID